MAFELPKLKYAFDALEPHIDARTMEIHHDRHHKGYVDNLNKAVAGSALEGKSLDALIGDLAEVLIFDSMSCSPSKTISAYW